MRIAMIGARGVPATFGGVEHHVEELGSRLAARGHEVTVYSRTNYVKDRRPTYRGLRVRYLPTVRTKYLEAITHSALSTLAAIARSHDIVHYHALGPGVPALLPRYFSRAGVALTVHGLDSERAKWGGGARFLLKRAEWLSARVPDATIVVSRDLAQYYAAKHRRSTWFIPNGVDEPTPGSTGEIASRFGLSKNSFVLFVGRIVPEKAPDLLVRAFRRIDGETRLVLAGGSSFTDDFVRSVKREASLDPRVLMTGYVYGSVLKELYTNAAAFVLPSSLEGLPMTLLEAASYGIPIVASDIPPHQEVIGSPGPGRRLFSSGDEMALASELSMALSDPASEKQGAESLKQRVLHSYQWDAAAEATEAVYEEIRR